MILANKHLVVALIVAPILAIIAYFGVDYLVKEKPHQAIAGEEYPLLVKSNCRWASGECTLQNGQVKINIVATEEVTGQTLLSLASSEDVSGVKIALVAEGNAGQPQDMAYNKQEEQDQWLMRLPANAQQTDQIQLAILISQSIYYAETGLAFIKKESNFTR